MKLPGRENFLIKTFFFSPTSECPALHQIVRQSLPFQPAWRPLTLHRRCQSSPLDMPVAIHNFYHVASDSPSIYLLALVQTKRVKALACPDIAGLWTLVSAFSRIAGDPNKADPKQSAIEITKPFLLVYIAHAASKLTCSPLGPV